jgi:cytochrome c oxidase subunit III
MSAITTTLAEYRRREGTNRLGLWLFLISDAFLFAGMFISRFYLLGTGDRPDVNQSLGLLITAVLLISSYFMYTAETAMTFGETKKFFRSLLLTILLGSVFLVGVIFIEWPMAHYNGSLETSIFFLMTGFHALHVLTGVLFLIIIYRNAKKGLYTDERHWPVEAAAVYWHFIDVVWVFFYPALYLIGRAAGG